MGKSRFAILAAGAFVSVAFSAAASAAPVNSEAECLANDGNVMELQGAKHCLVAILEEEYQSEAYGDLKGVKNCTGGVVRKTNIGDYCLVALEPIPAKAAPAVTENDGETAGEMKAEGAMMDADAATADEPKKKRGLFGR